MHFTIGISCRLPDDLREARFSGRRHVDFMEMGIRAPKCRNVDVFDEHRESTNGNISALLLLILDFE